MGVPSTIARTAIGGSPLEATVIFVDLEQADSIKLTRSTRSVHNMLPFPENGNAGKVVLTCGMLRKVVRN